MKKNPIFHLSFFGWPLVLATVLFAGCRQATPNGPGMVEPDPDGTARQFEREESHGLYVLRLGDGTTLTNHVGIPQTLLHYSVNGSHIGLVAGWQAPSAGAGRVNSVVADQSAGALRISRDGGHLIFTGRDQAVGGFREGVPQVIGRFSLKDRVFDTSTRVPGDDADGHYRAAVSLDGSGYWALGSSGGIHYLEHGAISPIQVLDVSHHYRNILVKHDTLWFTRSAGGTRGLLRTDPPGLPAGQPLKRIDLAAAGGSGWDRAGGGYGDFSFLDETTVFIGNNHLIEVFERESA